MLVFIDVKSFEYKYMEARRPGGIGCIAVHPSGKFIVYAEKNHKQPCIYMIEYPSMKVHKSLSGYSQRGYSSIAFNANGTKLASVGTDPDYLLSIWDWNAEQVLLRSKAFSQDVYQVAFSSSDDQVLTTSGMGHIKFWKIAKTFTGPKLQGYLGKFGSSELSDIAASVFIDDGKILSTTETGNMLLWDGGFIKCEISMKRKIPCHNGKIEVMIISESQVITAGDDGFVKSWELDTIKNADVSDSEESNQGTLTARVFEMEPLEQVYLGKGTKIKGIDVNPDDGSFIIQDSSGSVIKLDLPQNQFQKLKTFQANPIRFDIHQTCPVMIQMTRDAEFKLFDYTKREIVSSKNCGSPGTCLVYLDTPADPQKSLFLTGHEDGTLKLNAHDYLSIRTPQIYTLGQWRPHKKAISHIVYDETYVVTLSEDSTGFVFGIEGSFSVSQSSGALNPPKLTPLAQFTLSQRVKAVDLQFSSKEEIKLFALGEKQLKIEKITIKMPVNKKMDTYLLSSDSVVREEWTLTEFPETPVQSASKESKLEIESKILIDEQSEITAFARINAAIYVISFTNMHGESEIRLVDIGYTGRSRLLATMETLVDQLIFNTRTDWLFSVGVNGYITQTKLECLDIKPQHSYQVQEEKEEEKTLSIKVHGTSKIFKIAVSPDCAYIISSDDQSSVFMLRNPEFAVENMAPQQTYIYSEEQVGGAGASGVNDEAEIAINYTLEESLKKAGEDFEISQAENKKKHKRQEIEEIRQQWQSLMATIKGTPAEASLEQATRLYPQIDDDIEQIKRQKELEMKAELAWETEFIDLKLEKLNQFFFNRKSNQEPLRIENFQGDISLETFRTVIPLIKQKEQETALQNQDETQEKDADEFSSSGTLQQPGSKQRKQEIAPNKYDAKKQEKAFRAAKWKQLMDEKPDDMFEHPDDLKAVYEAKENMGDYKLKTSSDFIPNEDSMNINKKWDSILNLDFSIYEMKTMFNSQVKKLDADKQQIAKQIELHNNFVEKSNVFLSKYGEEQVLLDESGNPTSNRPKTPKQSKLCEIKDENQWKSAILSAKATQLKKSIQVLIEHYNENIASLYSEKVQLDTDLLFAEGKITTLYMEWLLLKEFEKKDKNLSEKLATKKNEKAEITQKINDCTQKLALKRVQVVQCSERIANILEQLKQSIGDNNKHEPFLISVFKKKIKRSKKSSDQSSDDSSDDFFSDDDLNDEDFENNQAATMNLPEICPSDCDPGLWQRVLDSRERKLDVEDELQDIQKSVELLKKDHDANLKKDKIVEAALKQIQAEMRESQIQKQTRMNELQTVVPVKPDQIYFAPTNENNPIVFSRSVLDQLKNRVDLIQNERAQVKKQHNILKKSHLELLQARKEKENSIEELKRKVENAQLLKFGKIVDLDKLEKLGSNKVADDLKLKLLEMNLKHDSSLRNIQKSIDDVKYLINESLSENTNLLNQLGKLREQRLQANSNSTDLEKRKSKSKHPQRHDSEDLKSSLERQQSELAQLQMELSHLLYK